ncbi:MAG: hypothetical protein JXR36_01305 [Bacteroidales bacterium]|nr:hypothetical protein [Bacteroidales bacterium]
MSGLGMNLMIRTLEPLIEKNLTDEKLSKIFDDIAKTYPIAENEIRNICTISKEQNGKIYFCIVGLDNHNKITSVKKQWKFVEGLKYLLSNFNSNGRD